MELKEFPEHTGVRRRLGRSGPEIYEFLNRTNNEIRHITSELKGSYHTMEEIRILLARLLGKKTDPSPSVFPQFHTDFGKTYLLTETYS